MKMESWQLIFVFFIVLMLARIIPRLLRARKMGNKDQKFLSFDDEQPRMKTTSPETDEMRVLGELNRGVKSFGAIKKNTQLNSKQLDSILSDLESRGLMRVQEKKGLWGIKIELLPTDKGLKEFYS